MGILPRAVAGAAPRPPLALRDGGATAERPVRRPGRLQADAPEDRGLYCVQCGALVTNGAARSERLGRHEHVFANPDDVVFRIGCFSRAPGCRAVGAATRRWSWFPGCSWRVAVCGACGVHLGWLYSCVGGERFHGLILAHLVERSEPD